MHAHFSGGRSGGLVLPYSHLFKNFPEFIVVHTVKGFGIVSKAEVVVFLELLLFRWSNGCWQFDCYFPLPFLNQTWTSGSSQFTYCWSLAWRILSITLLACEMSAIVRKFEHSLACLWDWNENCPFPVLWPLLSFPNLLAYHWVQHFHSIIF